jgi:protein-S-isoprenylcysteine O-methyltransferase Ste14
MDMTEMKNKPGETSGHTRVAIPPPLVFTAVIIIGVILDLLVPVNLLPGVVQLGVGLPVIGFSVFLSALSFQSFTKNVTTSGHKKKTAVLITDGPFRHTRNPLYLSGLLLVLGFGVLLDNYRALRCRLEGGGLSDFPFR